MKKSRRHIHRHRLMSSSLQPSGFQLFRLSALILLSSFFLLPSSFSSTIPFNQGWLFGGQFTQAATAPAFDDSSFERVTLPHTVTKFSWQNLDYNQWQHQWIYRKHFTLPENFKGQRVFLHFDGVMSGVTPVINGHTLETHLGGFLPANYEITKFLAAGAAENILAVEVDGRWSNVPPQGSKKGPESVDYLLPAGIIRQATLVAVPQIYLKDVFAKPVNVLDPATRRVEVACTLDTGDAAASNTNALGKITAELRDGPAVIARAEQQLSPTSTARQRPIVSSEATGSTNRESKIENPSSPAVTLTLTNLPSLHLWSPDTPKLYTLVTTLTLDGQPAQTVTTRIGFREAKFTNDGFFLNGKRLQIFGLNRHELFPYTGFAMPPRVMRRDAEILKRDFNLNFVRCSHYPQTEAFLDACDELGLLVWQEVPGWQYIGDAAWKDLLVRDARDMIIRDRNHPCIVIWGTRVNESDNNPALYRRTRAAARELDDSRPVSGSMHPPSRKNWQGNWEEDVFAYDDYHADSPGSVGILPPVEGHPYMLAETVGGFSYQKQKFFDNKYRRAGPVQMQMDQALYHAQAHDRSAANPRNSGAVAWCAFDYLSLVNGYNTVKCAAIADGFRIPKLGASFYMAQGDPALRPVIAPAFYWDFGPATPRGPGKHAAIFSNCDTLKVFLDGKLLATLAPDAKNYPNLKHAPFFTDLDLDGSARPELRIEGYLNNQLVLTRQFSSDPAQDKFVLTADDPAITGDGSDATRVTFAVVDKYGAPRAFAKGEVRLTLAGPGAIIGDTTFDLAPAGGSGAIWVRSAPAATGLITLTARHEQLGEQQITITVTP